VPAAGRHPPEGSRARAAGQRPALPIGLHARAAGQRRAPPQHL